MNNKQDLFERGNADEYEYNIQRSFFPPSKSSAEYETTILELSKEIADLQKKNDELAALRARVEELEALVIENVPEWDDSGLADGRRTCPVCLSYEERGHKADCRLAALSPKGDHVETGESDYMPWPQERGDTVSSFPDPEPTEGDDE